MSTPLIDPEIIHRRREELRFYNFWNRYKVGHDRNGSKEAYALYDAKQRSFVFVTRKRWKVQIGLFIAKVFGWAIMSEINGTLKFRTGHP